MPRIERRTLRAHRQLSATQVFTLASGCDWFNEWKTPAGDVDRAAMQSAWQDLAPELSVLHNRLHPGTRCWAWWAFQAPERRRILEGQMHPHNRQDFPERQKRLHYGCPDAFVFPECFAAVYESQRDYLTRLRCVTATEQRTLRALQDFEEEDAPRLTLAQIHAWLLEP